jgi:sugar phosphate isomerase/epimerase
MRLAVSNIAWPAGADLAALEALREHGATGVELALTKIWPEPLEASAREVAGYRFWWESQGIRIVALQALLFGKPGLTIFDSLAARQCTLDYLNGVISQAARLGAGALVFGSPANRLRGLLTHEDVLEIAIPFCRELGKVAEDNGVTFCIEPNPKEYGCDWLTNVAEAVSLVDAVGTEGVRLHLDTAAMTLAGDSGEAIAAAGERCRHFHVSAPYLDEVPGSGVDDDTFAEALQRVGYDGWVSIEMSEARLQPSWQESIRRALSFVHKTYSGAMGASPQRRAG